MFPFGGVLTASIGVSIALPATFVEWEFGIWPGTVTAGFGLASDGRFQRIQSFGAPSDVGNAYWMDILSRPATGSEYEVFVHQVSGHALAAGSDTIESWIPISSYRQFYLQTSSKFANWTATLEIQVRNIANPAKITGVCTATINVEQEF